MSEDLQDDSVLSDLDNDEPPSASPPHPSPADHRLRDLLAELAHERRARKSAEDSRLDLQTSLNRLKAFAQDVIKKRDDALREKDDALLQKEEALRQRDASRAEIETAAQMLMTGIEKISSKVGSFKNFSAGGGLPRSQKYTGLPAVAYGVIKRANEIAEELAAQVEAAVKSRDGAREQVEQRNYEVAIEVSELEATISGLREEAAKKGEMVEERNSRVLEMEREVDELRRFGDDCLIKLRSLEAKVDALRPVMIDQLKHVSRCYGQISEMVRVADEGSLEREDSLDSSFMWKEMDVEQNLRTALEGMVSICELAGVAFEKVKARMEKRDGEVKELEEKVATLLGEKQHIGTLLRSALSSKTSKVLQVAEEGLREAGINLNINGHERDGAQGETEDEVYTLAGALEDTVKTSQIEIVELRHLVEALRAESSLLKAHLNAQAKEISQLMLQIKELEEKEHMANESVEGLMTDIAAAEEEIARWKLAAEQEAAAGKEVEQEFLAQLSSMRQELEEAKHAMIECENKLKFKEETAAAAMAARDAAEVSLKLADVRAGRLRERLEELTRQLEQLDKIDLPNLNNHRYICWPWQWLGLNSVRYQPDLQENSNEMELSEPLI